MKKQRWEYRSGRDYWIDVDGRIRGEVAYRAWRGTYVASRDETSLGEYIEESDAKKAVERRCE